MPPRPDAIPGLDKREGDLVIGTLAGLREVKSLPTLVHAVGGLGKKAKLVIVGEGPEREAILKAATAMGLGDRLILPGFLPEPHKYIGLFDIFALSSLSEQFPIAVVEAMAAGLPVAATPVGDIAAMVAEQNRPYLARACDPVRLRDSLTYFVENPGWRLGVGAANRAKAQAEFDEDAMIASYAALYGDALARPGIFA